MYSYVFVRNHPSVLFDIIKKKMVQCGNNKLTSPVLTVHVIIMRLCG